MSVDIAGTHERRIAALEQEVAILRRSIQELRPERAAQPQETTEDAAAMLAGEFGMERQFHRIREITEAMFPREISVDVMADPESPQERFIVFNVVKAGDTEELIRHQRRWHEQVLRVAPAALDLFRISIAPA